jgi:serine/threonine protein kinase
MNHKLTNINICCFNPNCGESQNPEVNRFCRSCRHRLLLAERYHAIRLLGQGGFARTFLAIDRAQTPTSFCVIKQFWGEVQDIQTLLLPGFEGGELGLSSQIPLVRDQFVQDGVLYRVREYISGENLATVLAQKGTFNVKEVWQILSSLLPVIQWLHLCGVIHGDIKPENIICRVSLEPSQRPDILADLVLVDVGVAILPRAIMALESSSAIGSPVYAAPEQLRGKPVFASDLYSLGVTCIHLLTGIHPFSLFDFVDHRSIWQNYCLPDAINAQERLKHQQLTQLLDRMIAHDLKERFSCAEEVITEIEKIGGKKRSISMTKGETKLSQKSPLWRCYATLVGHHGLFASVNAVTIASDGKLLASASDDKTIRLWEIETGQQKLILQGHSQFVKSIAFHPTAQNILASGSRDRTINLWDIQTGSIIQTLTGHKHIINVVIYSPNGEMLASGSSDKTVILWDSQTGEIITSLQGHLLAVTALGFSPETLNVQSQAIFASASQDSTVKIWNLSTFESVYTLRGHTASVRAIAFSPNGKWLATAGEDRTIRLWDIVSWQCIRILSGHPWVVSALTFSVDGEILISGSWDKTIKLWDVNNGNEIAILLGHTDSVNCIAIDKNIIASGSNDQTIKLWKFREQG